MTGLSQPSPITSRPPLAPARARPGIAPAAPLCPLRPDPVETPDAPGLIFSRNLQRATGRARCPDYIHTLTLDLRARHWLSAGSRTGFYEPVTGASTGGHGDFTNQ